MPDELTAEGTRPPRAGGWRPLLLAALVGLLAGGGAMLWLGRAMPVWMPAMMAYGWHGAMPGRSPQPSGAVMTEAAMTAHITALEQRLNRIDAQASAEDAHTARAEALMVAYAARRAIDRGAPLGYLEDQLRLRFGEALPIAVATVITAGKQPMTLDTLSAQLLGMAPRLTGAAPSDSGWSRFRNDMANLFVLRREAAPGPAPTARLDHAQLCLREGRVDDAIADVQLLPDPSDAQMWIASARRYADVQRALDALETAAIMEPRAIHDANGRPVSGPLPAFIGPASTIPAAVKAAASPAPSPNAPPP